MSNSEYPSLLPLIWLVFLALFTHAQYATETASALFPDSTDPASACSKGNIHHVSVGGTGNNFDPAVTYANPDDIVVFTFWPSNHSVIRTDYTGSQSSGNPCVPIEVLQPGAAGFFSGNQIVESDPTSGSSTTWNLTIKDRSPIWFYCDAPGSCHPNGMVGVINPNLAGSFERQQAAAKAAPFQSGPTGTGSGGVTQKSSTSSTLGPGAIAGIAIGGLFVVALATSLCYFIGRSSSYRSMLRKRDEAQEQNASPSDATSPPMAAQGFSHLGPQPVYPAYPGYFVPNNKDLAPIPFGVNSAGQRFELNTHDLGVHEHDGTEIQSIPGSPTSPSTARSPTMTIEELQPQPKIDQTPTNSPGPLRMA